MSWLKKIDSFNELYFLQKEAGIIDWFSKNLGISIPSFVVSFLLSSGQLETFAKGLANKTPEQREELVQKITEDAKIQPAAQVPTSQPSEVKQQTSQEVNIEEWVDRIIHQESKGNPKAVSNKGAGGIMQIMPKTWTEMTRRIYGKPLPQSKRFDPKINKQVGIAYLKEIQKWLRKGLKKEPTIEQILAAYNGGPGRLIELKGNIWKMPKESVNYFQKITGKKK